MLNGLYRVLMCVTGCKKEVSALLRVLQCVTGVLQVFFRLLHGHIWLLHKLLK